MVRRKGMPDRCSIGRCIGPFFSFSLFEMLGMTWADSGALPMAHIAHVLKAREHFLPMYRI